MSSRFLRGTSLGGLESILLQSKQVSLTVVPAAGGKIIELSDRRSGRNWLWRNPDIAIGKASRDANFARDLDSGGWDEVLLSVMPGRIHQSADHIGAIPDHGDLLSREWAVDRLEVTPGKEIVCVMSTTGQAATYQFERQLRIPDNQAVVKFDYRMLNNGEHPVPWYWCAHPLLAVGSGATINIEDGMPMRIEDSATREMVQPGQEQFWPNLQINDEQLIDLSRSFDHNSSGSQIPRKVFVRMPDSGAASVRLASGEQITIRSHADQLPWLGLWINNGAWSGCGSAPYVNLGLEPATTPYDCINEAIDNDAVSWLQPGEERRWSLMVELQS